MKIDKTKLRKAAGIAKAKADEAKAAKDAPSLQGMAKQIADLTARIEALETK
tara:strand:+ start:1628 stop:1783 length:156 start_codon:yes stop_codon:yes gene_type:complete